MKKTDMAKSDAKKMMREMGPKGGAIGAPAKDAAPDRREQRERERLFFEREKSIVGILLNAVETAGYQFREKGTAQQGRLSLVFTNVFDSEARRAVFHAAQSENKNSFMAIMRG